MKKIYTIETTRNGHSHLYEGTVEYLTKNVFGYILEIGASWNKKINRNPKNINSLMSNLTKTYEEKEGSCYTKTFIRLVK